MPHAPSFTHARPMVANTGWGSLKMLDLNDIRKQAAQFRAKKHGEAVYVPEESRPYNQYSIRGVITIRFFSAEEWAELGEEFISNPARYLYMEAANGGRKFYPERPIMLTHEARMGALLASASADDEKVYTFIIGPSQTKINVHASIMRSMLQVPLLNDSMAEAASKTVTLPDDDAVSFEVFVKFLYKLEVSENDMWQHCYGLLRLANKYCIEMLHYMCEWYLCWRVQVRAMRRAPAMRRTHSPAPRRTSRRWKTWHACSKRLPRAMLLR